MFPDNFNLIIGLLHSLPYGTDSTVISDYYSNIIKPLVSKIYARRNVPLCVYYSGALLEMLEPENGAFFNVIREISDRKQIEILGGCFYESLLPFVPRPERIAGIEKLTTFIRQEFGKRPRGCFLGHGVWSQEIVPVFSTAGMDYVLFPDSHLVYAGIGSADIFKPYITEHDGKTLKLLPYVTRLPDNTYSSRYDDFLAFFASRVKTGSMLILLEDTSSWLGLSVADKKKRLVWWEGFIDFLSNKTDLPLTLPRDFSKSHMDYTALHLPELVLTKSGKSTGVYSGDYISRREEARLLYSKMQYVNTLVKQIRRDRSRKKTAKEDLLRGLSGHVYTNNMPGGIGDPVARFAAYSALLDAENNTREKGIFMPSVVKTDFDFDGRDEFLYQGNELNVYIKQKGACVFELDYLPFSWNFMAVCSVLNGGTKNNSYRTPRFFAEDKIYDNAPVENSKDLHDISGFSETIYDIKKYSSDSAELLFSAQAEIRKTKKKSYVVLSKKYVFLKTGFSVIYTLEHKGEGKLFFSPDFSFFLPPAYSWLGHIKNGEESSELILSKDRAFIADDISLYNVASKRKIRNFNIRFSYPVQTRYKIIKDTMEDKSLTQAYCLSPVIPLEPDSTIDFAIEITVGKGLPD
ncbi:glycoside hydrolase [Spirochaetia bacterium 38H-sp]|uniref:Glycoside hydrolase n=1 Tax=Rarispira pelagica TaxID=3141764 RepID=A0ABU9UE54_9SPIR